MESLEIKAKKGILSMSLTPRLKPFIEGTSLKAGSVTVPEGRFLIQIEILDKSGAKAVEQYRLDVRGELIILPVPRVLKGGSRVYGVPNRMALKFLRNTSSEIVGRLTSIGTYSSMRPPFMPSTAKPCQDDTSSALSFDAAIVGIRDALSAAVLMCASSVLPVTAKPSELRPHHDLPDGVRGQPLRVEALYSAPSFTA